METVKYYEVAYTARIGGTKSIIVKGVNEKNALQNAWFLRFTGKNFRVLGEVDKQQTEKGAGRNRAN